MIGGRIGKDGIHGATFSSEELHEGSPATAVQIGDPITQKRMTDLLLVARDRGLYNSITDNGAGGLSSSVGEMARDTGGCVLHLDKAPLKYEGLQPLGDPRLRGPGADDPGGAPEAYRRVHGACPPDGGGGDGAGGIHRDRAVSRPVRGKDGRLPRHGVSPRKESPPVSICPMETARAPRAGFAVPADLGRELLAMLSRLNVASKESVVRQYDHEVQGTSVIKPMVGAGGIGPSDAAVIRPILDRDEGVVIAHGICPKYSDIDTYHMAANAVDEAVSNAVAVGGDIDYLAGLDNFCWCDPVESEKNPDGRYKLAQLVRANRGLYDVAVGYGVPLISGKDSMKNDYQIGDTKISIPPTILFSVIGKMADVNRAVTMDAKRPGDLVYVLGTTKNELGGSEYFASRGSIGNAVPTVDIEGNLTRYRALTRAIGRGLAASAHDLSDAGLGTALAETALAGGLGMEIELAAVVREGVDRDDFLLFSESAGRFVVTVKPDDAGAFEEVMAGTVYARVGRVTEQRRLVIRGLSGAVVIDCPLDDLQESLAAPAHVLGTPENGRCFFGPGVLIEYV